MSRHESSRVTEAKVEGSEGNSSSGKGEVN